MRFIINFLLFFVLACGSSAYAQFPYFDSFKNSTAPTARFGGSPSPAKLTAGSIDPEGGGYLRLTDSALVGSGESAFARNITKFNSDRGLLVTFEYYSWGGKPLNNEGDGIAFFLFDASVVNDLADGTYSTDGFVIGGVGGALGYANFDGTPGLRKGYLGIGFDEFGNFATKDHSKQTGIEIIEAGVPGRRRENVTLRGDGNGLGNPPTNYEFIERVITTELSPGFTVQGKVDGRTKGPGGLTPTDLGYRKATIELVPNTGLTGYIINVWITEGAPGGAKVHHVIKNREYISDSPKPAQLSYGFAASTGGSTNFHEIRSIDIVIPPSQRADPVAVNDTVTTAEETVKAFNIIQNDYDPNGNRTLDYASIDLDPSTPAIDKTREVSGHKYAVDDQGVVTFTPAADFTGTLNTLKYTIRDTSIFRGVSNEGTLVITVTPVNDPPITGVIDKSGPEDVVLNFTSADFTGKFIDVDNDALNKIKIESLPANGTLQKGGVTITAGQEIPFSELATITFTPTLNFFGATSFLWSGSDGTVYSAAKGTVNITITPVDNDPPVAVDDLANTETNTPVTFSIIANDSDPDGNATLALATVDFDTAPGILTTITVPGQGTFVSNNNGTVTFTPVNGYDSGLFTTAPVSYTIKDNTGLTSNTATIAVKVNPKTPPITNPDEVTTPEDTNVTLNVIANDTDINGNNTINAASVDLDPNTGARQNSFTVAGQGTYTVSNAGVVTFVPVPNYNSGAGTATPISYTITDRDGMQSNVSSITITVTPVADAPVAVADAATTNEDNAVTFNVIANDTDGDGNNTIDPASIDFDPGAGVKTVLTVANEGTYTALPNGTVRFVPLADYNSGQGTATPVTYTIKDNSGLTSNPAVITVTVMPVNDLPLVSNISKSGNQGQIITFTDADFKTKFTDPEGSTLTRIKVVTVPLNGALKVYGLAVTAGQEILVGDLEGITFVPFTGWSGTTSFSWNGSDGNAYAVSNATVVINLTGVNKPPVVSAVFKNQTGTQPVAFTAADFTGQFSDPDNNALTKIQIVSLPAAGTLKLFGADMTAGQEVALGEIPGITFVPPAGTGGTYSFKWNGYDGTEYAAASSTVAVTITLLTLPPVVSDINKSGTGFIPVAFTAADFTSKFNNTLVRVKVVTLPANGTLRLNGAAILAGQEIAVADLGQLTFQPALNWGGTTSFSWNGYDGKEYAVNNANVNISILLPTDPNAKIGLAKKLSSVTDGINGSYILKFVFTVVNYGPNSIESISLKDNLALAFAGTTFTVKSLAASGNLKSNTSFNGNSDTELLLLSSKLNGNEEARVELEIEVRLVTNSGKFYNYAFVEGSSAITGARIQDRSTDGLKPDPLVNGDVSLTETTEIELAPRPTFVPQGFTPNNDGINDFLVIQNTMNQKVAIEVFNRWGNRVYKSVDYKNNWSGQCTEGVFIGQDIPDGTYFYVVVIADKDKYIGSLTVQR
ncbi:Ig-like domain-containing protein [Daejeonella sp. JGW-45]|uniref:Ig-like domain-containing protein n=1 Tax=Daejeonella sp. JGW-45 TaxID=3034148 RepID=UPI0023EAED03|nr:Ig-like domain-containing protein [Daejeonella sp. JGW-45]